MHFMSLSTSPSIPLYFLKTHRTVRKSKPKVELYLGADKTGLIFGVGKLHLNNKGHDIGIGDWQKIYDEGETETIG